MFNRILYDCFLNEYITAIKIQVLGVRLSRYGYVYEVREVGFYNKSQYLYFKKVLSQVLLYILDVLD